MEGLRANILIQGIFFLIVAAVFHLTGTVFVPDRAIVVLFLIPITLFGLFTYVWPDRVISLMAQGMFFILSAGCLGGSLALAALRAGAPAADARLDSWDHHLGVHTEKMVGFLSHFDRFDSLLFVAYQVIIPVIMITAVVLAIRGRASALYRLLFVFAVSVMLCGASNALIPSSGSVAWHHVDRAIMSHFPGGSGLSFVPTWALWHSGQAFRVSPWHFSGVVGFPSFHAVMAFIVLFFLRGPRWLNICVSAYVLLVLISTICIGGHYCADILGGIAVFFLSWLMARRVIR